MFRSRSTDWRVQGSEDTAAQYSLKVPAACVGRGVFALEAFHQAEGDWKMVICV